MDNLIISIFSDEMKAEEARGHLLLKEERELLDIEDAVIMKKTSEGKVIFRHLGRQTLSGALLGAFCGAIGGLLLLNPVFIVAGLTFGLIIGGVTGALSHLGVDTDFASKQAESMAPGSSALLVMTRTKADKVIEEIGDFNGNVVQNRICAQNNDERHCSILPGIGSTFGTA